MIVLEKLNQKILSTLIKTLHIFLRNFYGKIQLVW